MNFWNTLRWAGALCFVALVLLAWLGAQPQDSAASDGARPAPRIVR